MLINKWTIFSSIFLGYATFSYNRKVVSYAVPTMLKEGLDRNHVGLILSLQNLAYLISKFFGGILSDKLSARVLFGTGLIMSGFATVVFSRLEDLTTQQISWFFNGLSQGVGWPAIAKLLKNWFSPSELGTWWSIASASANLSGCAGPFIFTILSDYIGWRNGMVYSGLASVAMGLFCYLFLKDSPIDSEHSKIKVKTDKRVDKGEGSPSIVNLLFVVFIWVISICYLSISIIKTALNDWSQVFLMNDRGLTPLSTNSLLSSIEFGGLWGGIIAGFLSDRLMSKNKSGQANLPSRGHPRMWLAMFLSFLTASSLYVLYNSIDSTSPLATINMIGLVLGASVYGQIALYGIVATESVINELSGSAHAIAALCANLGSMIAGYPLTIVAKEHNWSRVFLYLQVISSIQATFMIATCLISYRMTLPKLAKKKKI